jgi:sulfate permease, SulP family
MTGFATPPRLNDINAGLLVALVGIPQCLAYAMLSGLPPMYGLVTAAIPGLVAALLGRSPAVTVGPTNTTGLIILTSLTPWADNPELLLTATATLAALAGLSRLLIVLFRAERIFDFVPEAVMVGFATGAAIIIALMQLDELLGPPFQSVRSVINELNRLAQFDRSNFSQASLLLGVTALLSVILGKKYLPRLPVPLTLLIASIVIVRFDLLPIAKQWVTLGESTEVSDGWPLINYSLPGWSMIQALIIPGFAVAFIGSLELIVTLRQRGEQRLLAPELRSQGIANIVGSLTGAFPASTSLTRSVLLDIGGAKTQWAPMIAALTMLPILLFGAEAIRSIPQPVIAGLLIATALSMLKPAAIRQMLKVNHQTRTLFLVTVLSTLVLTFHEAILLGAGLGILLFLIQASKTSLITYRMGSSGQLIRSDDLSEEQSALIQISGSLYFAAARQLPERLDRLLSSNLNYLVLDLTHTHQCRIAAIQALLQFSEQCSLRGIRLDIAGSSEELRQLCNSMGVRLPFCGNGMHLQWNPKQH